ncbi:class I SAM-dependent methyltransferase [Desulfosporosinus meridiei]|uniref:Methylase involved in ubiquinone/menaquinone biosynthesis n=1 Tax=Desulfosporosinus meridiei (strain ATCC BAA-275 / DSM 13257 / KCTC 12902 / NCIMB 13706 / S10) TaxID=768704 RepID=J7IQZ1_DESMD|nr:methyltransferase domain-containing protein [Desulfosporosinus meridiei]AFQ42599.1 methylase involved in ubiquinone/menaquinone biosynthesis [Desulfosporosinus meridiei DSM 13257]
MHIQKQIENYWQTANERYNETIQKELKGVKKEVWVQLLNENRPPGEKLEVLDIGTGPGFFPLLLSELGHRVTAIDCTESMLATARENVKAAGFEVSFHLMDAHKLAFEDNSFDFILTRNVTWLMYDPSAAYREWHRVLKPGGRLLIFDANYYLWQQDSQWQEEFERDHDEAVKLGFKKFDKTSVEESNKIAEDLFFSKIRRPQWDIPVLLSLGFGKIYVEGDLSEKISDEISKVRYRTIPPFMIRAEKTDVRYLYGLDRQDSRS